MRPKLEESSRKLARYVYLPIEVGMGPTMSQWISSKGSVAHLDDRGNGLHVNLPFVQPSHGEFIGSPTVSIPSTAPGRRQMAYLEE